MEIELLLSFLGASIMLSLLPGPDNIFVLTESVTRGAKNGVAIAMGLCCGIFIHTLMAATGLSIILKESEIAFSAVKYLGAAYMFYLAYKASQNVMPALCFNTQFSDNVFKAFPLIRKGFLMNILNPKVSLFFIAFLPHFISNNGVSITLQLIILGVVFMLQALVIFSLIAILSSKLTRFVNHPKFWKITQWVTTMILLVLGIILAFSDQ